MSEWMRGKRQCSQYNMCELGKFNIKKYQNIIVFCIFARYCPLKYLIVFLSTTRNEKRLAKTCQQQKKRNI